MHIYTLIYTYAYTCKHTLENNNNNNDNNNNNNKAHTHAQKHTLTPISVASSRRAGTKIVEDICRCAKRPSSTACLTPSGLHSSYLTKVSSKKKILLYILLHITTQKTGVSALVYLLHIRIYYILLHKRPASVR